MDFKVKYSTMIVKYMDESINFYNKMFGFEIDSQYQPAPHIKITLMKSKGDTLVELIQCSEYPVGFWSVGIDIKDMDAAMKEFRAKEV